jgi:hypothetical protein
MRRVALIGAVALFAAPVGPARADVRFEGQSSQGGFALVVAEDDGVPKRALIRWRADCRRPGFRIQETTTFRRPLDLSARRRFRDAGLYRRGAGNGYRLTVVARISGRKVTPRRWIGSFRARVVVRRAGRERDRCSVRGVRWRVARP